MFAIFGASGKIGGTAIAELLRRNLPVRAVLRDPFKANELAKKGCEIAMADLRDIRAVKTALEEADGALVICPMTPRAHDAVAEPLTMIEAISKAIKEMRPPKIVAISDYGAHHQTGTGVALVFHQFEERLRSTPVASVFLRSCEQMQNWIRFLPSVTTKGVLPIFHQTRGRRLPLVSAIDVGLLAAEFLIAPPGVPGVPEVVHAEGPQRYSPDDLVETFQRLLGRAITGREIPREDWVPTLIEVGLSQSYAQLIAGMYDAHNAGLIEVEPGGEIRRGTTPLASVLGSLFEVLDVSRTRARQ